MLSYTLHMIVGMGGTQSNIRKRLLPCNIGQIALGYLEPNQNRVECHKIEVVSAKM